MSAIHADEVFDYPIDKIISPVYYCFINDAIKANFNNKIAVIYYSDFNGKINYREWLSICKSYKKIIKEYKKTGWNVTFDGDSFNFTKLKDLVPNSD